MKTPTHQNVRVIAENNPGHEGFNIYLDFSGQREYLMSHRHNCFMYDLMKNGIRLKELQMLSVSKTNRYVVLEYRKRIRYLLTVIYEYLEDRYA